MKKNKMDPDILKELLSYNPKTGLLHWKLRSDKWFSKPGRCAVWNRRYAGREALSAIDSSGYKRGTILGVRYLAHRVAWTIYHGYEPDIIDHYNRNKIDNSISNLRSVSVSDNLKNSSMKSSNTSGHTGIHRIKESGRFKVMIGSDADRIYVGTFDTLSEAIYARKQAEVRYKFHPNHGVP